MSDTRPHDDQHRDRFLARLRARLSYANVTATLALFLALTGTATAADRPAARQRRGGADPGGCGALVRDPGGCRPRLGDPRREHRARRSLARRPRLARRSARAGRRQADDALRVRVAVLRLAGLPEPAGDPPPRRALARSGQARRPRRLREPRQHLRPRPERHHDHRRGAVHRRRSARRGHARPASRSR